MICKSFSCKSLKIDFFVIPDIILGMKQNNTVVITGGGAKNLEQKTLSRRLRFIDAEIRSKTYPNAVVLSHLLEVSSRTVRRDIEELKLFYNAPIAFDKVKNGYYYTEDSFYIKDMFFNESEIDAIGLLESSIALWKNTIAENVLHSIFQKLIASLDSYSQKNTLSRKITYISAPQSNICNTVFSDVFLALKEQKEISFAYRPLQKQTFLERKIQPYHVVCQRGNWYVIGFDYYKEAIRLFSFARMKDSHILDKTFTVPEDFDYRDWIDENFGVYASEQDVYKVRLLFAREVGAFALSEKFTENQSVEEKADGSVEVSFATTQFSEILRFVLSQGSTVRVLEPEELIDAVKEEAEKVRKLYEA